MPSQNVGSEINSAGRDCSALLSQRRPGSREAKARAKASATARAKAGSARLNVSGRLLAISALTGSPACSE